MDTTSTASSDAEHQPTATIANILRVDDATDKRDRTDTNAPPFFRLPRELRDEIYELATLSEGKFYYDITLRADGPAQKTVYIDRGAHRTFSNSQFEIEFSAAAERRVKSFVTGGDGSGLRLVGPGPQDYVRATALRRGQMFVKAEDVWLEVSKGPRADGEIGNNIHTLVLVIPLVCPRTTPTPIQQSVIFKFKFPDKAELGPRVRLDCYWDGDVPDFDEILHFPSDDGSIVQQVLNIAKEVDWKGSMREYMLWQRYILRYAHKGPSPTFF
jgi:hypothetical protein